MLLRLLAVFIVIPLVELYLLLQVAEATSVTTTIAIVLGTGILGSILARREGAVAWRRFRLALAEGRMPSQEIQEGLMIVFAAGLLLTPGLLTDALGFLMLIPASRSTMRRWILERYLARIQFHASHASPASEPLKRQPFTIDAEHFEAKR